MEVTGTEVHGAGSGLFKWTFDADDDLSGLKIQGASQLGTALCMNASILSINLLSSQPLSCWLRVPVRMDQRIP